MIAIKNADGTLVPVIESNAGASRMVALSLVHSHQKRAEILLYELQDSLPTEHVRDLPQPEPFGKLVLRRLPDNPFGEVEIQATLNIDQDMRLQVTAEAAGEKAVKGNFRIPSAGLGQAERQDQMDSPDDQESEDEIAGLAAMEGISDDLFDPNFDTDYPPVTVAQTQTPPEMLEFDLEPHIFDEPEPTEMTQSLDTPEPDESFESLDQAPLPPSDPDAFINDPEDMDWGFDELADPSDAEVVPADTAELALMEPEIVADPDFIPDIDQDPELSLDSDDFEEPVPATKSRQPRANSSGIGQKLMWASAVLFVVSLTEIGLYFLLRMHMI